MDNSHQAFKEMADKKYRDMCAQWIAEAIADLISSEELEKEITDEFVNEFGLDEARRHIEERFEKDRSLSWRKALEESLEEARERHSGAFRSAVENKLCERLAPETGETS